MTCPCAVNPDPHGCVWVLPWQAGALVIRPIQTIHTWRKKGRISSRRHPETGLWQVCNCEALAASEATATRWEAKYEANACNPSIGGSKLQEASRQHAQTQKATRRGGNLPGHGRTD